jgi:hypothetical protein
MSISYHLWPGWQSYCGASSSLLHLREQSNPGSLWHVPRRGQHLRYSVTTFTAWITAGRDWVLFVFTAGRLPLFELFPFGFVACVQEDDSRTRALPTQLENPGA